MSDINVKIVQLATSKTVEVQLPDNVAVARLLPVLAKRLGIEAQQGGVTEYKLSYKQPNPPDPFEFQEQDTLAAKDVKAGSLLAFSHSFVAGCMQ
jgi:hypothetical protein